MSELESGTFDPKQRRLCPDGECVGLIGPDGRCRLCGTEDDGEAPRGLGVQVFAGGCAEETAFAMNDAGEHEPLGTLSAEAGESVYAGRALCPDGSCVGVVGSDGRCGECGREAAAVAPLAPKG